MEPNYLTQFSARNVVVMYLSAELVEPFDEFVGGYWPKEGDICFLFKLELISRVFIKFSFNLPGSHFCCKQYLELVTFGARGEIA